MPFSRSLLALACVGASTFFFVSTAQAAGTTSPTPTVNGNTISVANDGWYQIQRRSDYKQMCSGVSQCTVDNGHYIVINHTTGQRWESIEVSGGNTNPTQPQVQGNTIVYPNSGWYQVQDSSTYKTLCEGRDTSCTVPNGTYHVINHSTGTRYNFIRVNGETTASPLLTNLHASRYSTTAAELFWEATAQSAANQRYTILRDGIVLGQTTGRSYFDSSLQAGSAYTYEVRAENSDSGLTVEVAKYNTTTPPPSQSQILNISNAEEIMQHVISVINEDQIDAFFVEAQNDLNFFDRTFFLTNTVSDIVYSGGTDNLDPPYQMETGYLSGDFTSIPSKGEYTCAMGGYIYNYYKDRVFDNCLVGNNTYNGTSGSRNDNVRGTIRGYPFYDFSQTDTNGVSSVLNGGYYTGNESFVVLNQSRGWKEASYSTQIDNEPFTLSKLNVSRVDKSAKSFGGNNTRYTLDDGSTVLVNESEEISSIKGSFDVAAAWSQQQTLQVQVDLGFSDTIRVVVDATSAEVPGGLDPEEPFQWQSGSIKVTASDGSSITMTPTTPASFMFNLALSNGESLGPLPWTGSYTVDCSSDTLCGSDQ